LRRRCKGENPQNKVFAKTGSMTSISSLTGYAQGANGHMYAFVIINQGVKSAKEGRDFQDKVCKALTRKY
jgi:D-alanyl-D-alanine carboxypeptidase/D-alanyl-D-alanine-endopeptidase (penicillin-binding protein 4)